LQSTTALSTGLGNTGLAVTGGAFYNQLSYQLSANPYTSLALANEGRTLDSCLGHSDTASGSFFVQYSGHTFD
jgi:hypothetical protein